MRKIFMSLLVLSSVFVNAQENTIVPSGNIITKNVNVQSFDGIKAEGLYELILTQGDKESVKIEADDNLVDFFSVKNNGSKLEITMPGLKDKSFNIKNKDDKRSLHLKVYVQFKKLNNLEVALIGNVRSENAFKSTAFNLESKSVGNVTLKVSADKLVVHNEGVGNITLSGNANNADVTNKGVGQFDGEDLLVQTMNIDNSGVGHANVNVAKDLTIKQSFLGKVSNKGSAKARRMEGVAM